MSLAGHCEGGKEKLSGEMSMKDELKKVRVFNTKLEMVVCFCACFSSWLFILVSRGSRCSFSGGYKGKGLLLFLASYGALFSWPLSVCSRVRSFASSSCRSFHFSHSNIKNINTPL